MQRPDAVCWRDFRSLKHKAREAICMEKPLETAWVGLWVRWGKVSWNYQGRGKQCEPGWWSLKCGACLLAVCVYWCRESQKRNNSLCQYFFLAESCPPQALTLMLNNSFSPNMSLVPFKLLPQHWSSEGVSWVSQGTGPLKRNCLGLQKPSMSLSHYSC